MHPGVIGCALHNRSPADRVGASVAFKPPDNPSTWSNIHVLEATILPSYPLGTSRLRSADRLRFLHEDSALRRRPTLCNTLVILDLHLRCATTKHSSLIIPSVLVVVLDQLSTIYRWQVFEPAVAVENRWECVHASLISTSRLCRPKVAADSPMLPRRSVRGLPLFLIKKFRGSRVRSELR